MMEVNSIQSVGNIREDYPKEKMSKEVTNTPNEGFKDILKKEITYSKNQTNESEKLNIKNKEVNDDILTISDKIEELLLEDNFQGNDFDENTLEEIMLLLNKMANLLQVSVEVRSTKVDEEKVKSESINNIDDNLSIKSLNIDLKNKISNLIENIENKKTLIDVDGKVDIKKIENLIVKLLNKVESDNLPKTLSEEELVKVNEILSLLKERILNKEDLSNVKGKNKDSLNQNLKKIVLEDKSIKVDSNFSEEKNELSTIKNQDLKYINKVSNLENTESKFEETGVKKEEKEISGLLKEDKVLSKILGKEDLNVSKVLSPYERIAMRNIDIIKEPIPVLKQTMGEDIIKNVKFMMRNEISELKVKIYPKELGEMTIKILSEEGIMRAEIKATSKETYNLLNSNLNDIKKGLSDQNIKIHDVNIGLYQEDTTFFSGNNQRDNFNNQKENQSYNENKTIKINGLEDLEEGRDTHNDSNVNLLA
ncbi:flagellar hook-length control protein FliK [Clostridium carnis]